MMEVKPGMSDKTELRYKGQGNQHAGCPHSDLVIKFTQEPHDTFKRVGSDLVTTQKISLAEAIKGHPISLRTLDNRQITLAIDELISP